MSEPRLNLVMPEPTANDTPTGRFEVSTDGDDFTHEVLVAALTKYMEKYEESPRDTETLMEIRNDVIKFLNRMVKTSADVVVTEQGAGMQVSFELVHELK